MLLDMPNLSRLSPSLSPTDALTVPALVMTKRPLAVCGQHDGVGAGQALQHFKTRFARVTLEVRHLCKVAGYRNHHFNAE